MDRKFPDHEITSINERGSYRCAITTKTGVTHLSKAVFYQFPGKNNKE